jgi:hypothetical protein
VLVLGGGFAVVYGIFFTHTRCSSSMRLA